jgi:hypothetical protein
MGLVRTNLSYFRNKNLIKDKNIAQHSPQLPPTSMDAGQYEGLANRY